MPFIRTTTNVKITDAQRESMKLRMGQAIELLPGKSEQWLMLAWQDDTTMAFQGKDTPCALCEVKLYGASTAANYNRLTAALCRLLEEELGIPQNRTYVAYDEVQHWGWDGENF